MIFAVNNFTLVLYLNRIHLDNIRAHLKLDKMKKILLFLFVIILTSCSKEFDLDQFPQEWKLISMSSNQITPAIIITGFEMEWQETYTLNSDGTFTKSRNRDGVITDASGTFVFKDSSNEKYLELSFVTGISLVSSCYPGKEMMWVRSETKLQGTWSYCDGIGLEYERIK
jgi:hypothetical protein